MTYVPVDQILKRIPNKFEAIKVTALECRRLNDKLRAMELSEDHKITTMAVDRLIEGEVSYYDARERREQERSEAMLAAAESMLDMTAPDPEALAELEGEAAGEEPEVAATEAATASAPAEEPVEEAEEETAAAEDEDATKD
jgi:DNA-directed RNA polymerase subunit K/omega